MKTIFLVEDNQSESMLMEMMISEALVDCKIIRLDTGKKCLEEFKLHKPDLVILDYGLPDMKGLEVLEEIKNIAPKTPVIMLSAQDDVNIVRDLLKEGAEDYIPKGEKHFVQLYKAILKALNSKGKLFKKYQLGKFELIVKKS